MKKIFTVILMLLFFCFFTGCSAEAKYYAKIISISNEEISIKVIGLSVDNIYNTINVEKNLDSEYYATEYGDLELKSGDIIEFTGVRFCGWSSIKNIKVIRNINDQFIDKEVDKNA